MKQFIFTARAARDAYYADICARHPPTRVPDHLIAPGTSEDGCWTLVPVDKSDAGGLFFCGVYPGEATPAGATREDVERNPITDAITRREPIAEPTRKQLDDARAAKDARQPRLLAVAEPTRDGEERLR